MKKLLIGTILLSSLLLSSCSFIDASKAKEYIIDNTFVEKDSGYIPKSIYTLSFTNDDYTLSYHQDALKTSEVDLEEINLSVTGTWAYGAKVEHSWVGDWNITHHITYYIVSLSEHPKREGETYFCFELDSGVGYLCNTYPSGGDYLNGLMLVKQSKE